MHAFYTSNQCSLKVVTYLEIVKHVFTASFVAECLVRETQISELADRIPFFLHLKFLNFVAFSLVFAKLQLRHCVKIRFIDFVFIF